MLIQSVSVLALLTEKVQQYAHDLSRHLLCPSCRTRTKLYALQDGRKKCSICGKKFDTGKKTDVMKLKQYADILLCFCLDFPAQQTSRLTGYRYRLVGSFYERFRILLAEQTLSQDKMLLLTTVETRDRGIHDSALLRQGRTKFSTAAIKAGDAPVFGVKFLKGGQAFIEPLKDDSMPFLYDKIVENEAGRDTQRYADYAGFIRLGKFQRFTDNEKLKDGAENLWAWMSERMQRHHGIWKRNVGLYLKELEWKYNNRLLAPEAQASKIAQHMPPDFLTRWSPQGRKDRESVQSGA